MVFGYGERFRPSKDVTPGTQPGPDRASPTTRPEPGRPPPRACRCRARRVRSQGQGGGRLQVGTQVSVRPRRARPPARNLQRGGGGRCVPAARRAQLLRLRYPLRCDALRRSTPATQAIWRAQRAGPCTPSHARQRAAASRRTPPRPASASSRGRRSGYTSWSSSWLRPKPGSRYVVGGMLLRVRKADRRGLQPLVHWKRAGVRHVAGLAKSPAVCWRGQCSRRPPARASAEPPRHLARAGH